MRINNKMPFIPMYTTDMLIMMNGMCAATRGIFNTLIYYTWSRKCEWISIEEAREITAGFGTTPKQFERAIKEMNRYVANGVFKFTALEEIWNEKVNISIKNSQAAKKRWDNVKN